MATIVYGHVDQDGRPWGFARADGAGCGAYGALLEEGAPVVLHDGRPGTVRKVWSRIQTGPAGTGSPNHVTVEIEAEPWWVIRPTGLTASGTPVSRDVATTGSAAQEGMDQFSYGDYFEPASVLRRSFTTAEAAREAAAEAYLGEDPGGVGVAWEVIAE